MYTEFMAGRKLEIKAMEDVGVYNNDGERRCAEMMI